MKKAVAHLIPFMEKEREERQAQLKADGKEAEEEVRKLAELYHAVNCQY